MDKKQRMKRRAREHAEKHDMSYQAAYQQLFGNPGSRALEFWDWMEHVDGPGRGDCLTIGDVLGMKEGERVELLVMDRNLCDHVYPQIGEAPRPTLPAETFFDLRRDGAVYVHERGLRGRMEWGWDHGRECVDDVFMFEIEFKPGHWHPLDPDGTLPAANEEYDTEKPEGWDDEEDGEWDGKMLHWEELPPKRTHWKDYPETTRVGWRGPAMRWEHVPRQPPVFTNIDVDRLAVCTLLPMIKDVLGLEDDRLWMERDDEGWLIVVRDLTESERDEIGRRFSGARVVSRAEWRRSEMVLGEERRVLTEQEEEREKTLVAIRVLMKGDDGIGDLARLIQSEIDAFIDEEVEKKVGPEERRDLLRGVLAEIAADAEIDRATMAAVLDRFRWPDGVEPPTVEDVLGPEAR